MAIHLFDARHDGVETPLISRQARLVIGPQSGARQAILNYVVLEPGEANHPHRHRASEDTVFILRGFGQAVDYDHGVAYLVGAGDTVWVPPGVLHAVGCTGPGPMVSVGGPCPPDWELLRAVGISGPGNQ